MRPLLLTVEGVKSIAEKQTVNFEKLAQNGIFGIFGKTGSGKSSILDAIILALYGEVISKIDNSDFVNTNCNQAIVELVFLASGQGEKNKYRVKRIYKFDKNRNKLKQPEAFLWQVTKNGEIPIAEGTKNVNPKIRDDIIGLEKEDFLKCIALPQGEFSAFVKLTRSERLKVIGKLFNLQKYGKELYDKVRNKDNDLFLEENSLNGELNALGELNLENFENIKKEYLDTKELLVKIKEQDTQNKKQLQIAQNAEKLLNDQKQKNEDITKKLAYKSVIEGYKQEIKAYDNALIVKEIITTCDQEQKTLTQSREKLERALLVEKREKELFEVANKNYQSIDGLQAQKTALAEKRAIVKSNSHLNDDLIEKNNQTNELRKRYSQLNNEITGINSKREEHLLQIKSINEKLEKINPVSLLEKLSGAVSLSGLNSLILDEINFLKSLSLKLEEVVENYSESAVNGLISQHINKINALLQVEDNKTDVKKVVNEVLNALDENTKLNGEREGLLNENKNLLILANKIQAERDEVLQNGKTISEECKKLTDKLNEVLGGVSYEQALKLIDEEVVNIDAKLKSIKLAYENATESYNRARMESEKLSGAVLQLEDSLKKHVDQLNQSLAKNQVDLQSVKAVLSQEKRIEANKITVNSYEKNLHALETALSDLNVKLKDIPKEYFNLQFFVEKCEKSQSQLEEINKKYGEIQTRYEMGLKNKEKWCIIVDKLNLIKENRNLYGKLIELFKFDRFMEYVAEEYLTEIASIAGRRVLELTNGRYGLLYKTLDNFYVTDNLKGGALRPVASLSGGETFLVSLSLALALSFKISSKAMRPIDFFFLDEGFGTLDEELINTVTDSLEKLHQSSLTVGLITHVAELKNRIQSKLYVSGATATHGTVITESY